MDCIIHGVAKSLTQLSNFHFHFKCNPGQAMSNRKGLFIYLFIFWIIYFYRTHYKDDFLIWPWFP